MQVEPGTGFVWVLLVVLGVGTFGLRLTFIQFPGWLDELPPRVERGMAFVPAAILAALVFPELFSQEGSIVEVVASPRVLAGGLAAVVAWRTGSMILTIGTGMGVLWIAHLVIG